MTFDQSHYYSPSTGSAWIEFLAGGTPVVRIDHLPNSHVLVSEREETTLPLPTVSSWLYDLYTWMRTIEKGVIHPDGGVGKAFFELEREDGEVEIKGKIKSLLGGPSRDWRAEWKHETDLVTLHPRPALELTWSEFCFFVATYWHLVHGAMDPTRILRDKTVY